MFPAPWSKLPDFVAHDWPPYNGEQTLAEIARHACDALEIQDGDVLVGASLGGMVACEAAKIRKLRALFLVGSATSKDEVSQFLAILHPLANLAPIEWLQFSAGKIPGDLAQMFANADGSFVRSMCGAVFKWNGLGPVSVPHYRIHGRRDLIIPPPARTDLLLDGGHLISVTHATECAEFVGTNNQVEGTAASARRDPAKSERQKTDEPDRGDDK